MKIFLAITAFVGVVVADIGITSGTASGYHYNVPHTSYGVPSQGSSNTYNTRYTGNSNFGYTGNNNAAYSGNAGYKGYQGQNAGYQGLSSGYQSSNFGNNYQSSGAQNAGAVQYHPQLSSDYQNTASLGHSSGASVVSLQAPHYQQSSGISHGSSQQYQSSYLQKYQEYYRQQQQQPAQVFKHFYVHAAPEEPEQPKFRQPPVLPAPQKHYKIIFIKTPAQAVPAPQFIPIQQQNEEKTIVYVLVQKPEEAAEVVVPKIEQKPPTKPEVFFIKYNDKEGSQAVINNIVNDYNKGQGSSVSYSGLDSSSASGVSSVSGSSSATEASTSYNLQSDGVSSGNVFSHSGDGSHAIALASDHSHGAVGGSTEGHGYNVATSEAGTVNGFNTVESDAIGQSGFSSGGAQNVEGFNSISTSQGVPHENYGVPKFRVN